MTPAIMVIVYEIYWSFRVNGGCGEKQVLKQWCETSGYRCNTGTRLDTNGWPLNIVNGILSLKIKLTLYGTLTQNIKNVLCHFLEKFS